MAQTSVNRRKAKPFPPVAATTLESGDNAHEAWLALDRSNNRLRAAKALLQTVYIALRHPEICLDEDDAADSLGVLGELLEEIGSDIESARAVVHGLDKTVEVRQ